MKTLPDIGARVRLSAFALERLAKSPGRARSGTATGEVVGHNSGRAVVRWPGGVPDEPFHPVYLELAT